MKIKERKKSNFFHYLKKVLNFIYKGIFNRKTKIIFWIIVVAIFFLIGILLGLLISGFFGTFDEPSERAINLMHFMGIKGLKELKVQIEGIRDENIKIPINYIKGKFSNPKKIYIDIGFKDYQKLEYKRQQALDLHLESLDSGILISSGADYVPAKIRYKDEEVNVKLRLKGDWTDHLNRDKWSFRIKIRGNDTLFGMKTFSIQDPELNSYLKEKIYHEALKKEGVLCPRYDFIEVVINGKNKGIYALIELPEKQMIERNNRREGVVIKFDEDPMWEEILNVRDYFTNELDWTNYCRDKHSDWFYAADINSFSNKKILEDPVLARQFDEAKNLLESFRKGSLKTHEVFDADKLAKFFAVNTVMGTLHSSYWNNIRFYYNPITSRLEPIGREGNLVREIEAFEIIEEYLPDCLYDENNYCQTFENQKGFCGLVFRDKVFFEKYMQELKKVSQESYLDKLFLGLDAEIKRDINIIHKDKPSYHFTTKSFYRNQKQIKGELNPVKNINAYFQASIPSQNKIIVPIGNIQSFPLEIINLVYNDTVIFELNQGDNIIPPKTSLKPIEYQKFEFRIPENFIWEDRFKSSLKINYKIFGLENIKNESVLGWLYMEEDFLKKDFIRQKSNLSSFNMLKIDENTKKIFIENGKWTLDQSIIIPKGFNVFCNGGTVIDLINGATILSYSNLQFSGTKDNLIKIISSDGTGQGLAILNADKISRFKYVTFDNLRNPFKEGWELTGAVTFYESPIILDNVVISKANAEDGLNIINSKFEIKNSIFENCSYDCFDNDFGNGSIKSSLFIGCGNDGLDFSGSNVNINNLKIFNIRDKAISVGEKSNITIENIEIDSNELNKTYIAIASKDQSHLFIKDSQISNVKYVFAVYQKKSEFGSASIETINVNISEANNNYIIEEGSNLLIDNVIILKKEKEVYKKLYEL